MKNKVAFIAGHSVSHPGAIAYDRTDEHSHTKILQRMIVSLRSEAALYDGSSMMPVTDHEELSLRSVINLINANSSLNRAIDIHFNYNHPTATGTEVIVHPHTTYENKILASEIVKGIASILNISHRKRKKDRDYIFPSETPRKRLAIIEQTNIPVILIEVCFLNSIDLPIYLEKKEEVAYFLNQKCFS